MELRDKTVIVTGAGRGVGRALAIAFGAEGARVVCAARREAEIAETARLVDAAGGTGLAITCDVTDREQTEALAARTLAAYGQIHVLFNNAGSFSGLGGVWEVDPEVWWRDVEVNLRGSMLCSRAVLPHMMDRGEGIIINMRGGEHIPGGSGYSSSKVAVSRLTELMAKEQEREASGVVVIGMGPGFVRTEMTEKQLTDPQGRKWLPSSQAAIDAGRDKPPEACAAAAVALIRLACPGINGRHDFGPHTDFAKLAVELGESAGS